MTSEAGTGTGDRTCLARDTGAGKDLAPGTQSWDRLGAWSQDRLGMWSQDRLDVWSENQSRHGV